VAKPSAAHGKHFAKLGKNHANLPNIGNFSRFAPRGRQDVRAPPLFTFLLSLFALHSSLFTPRRGQFGLDRDGGGGNKIAL
jgi:hypothetical protein